MFLEQTMQLQEWLETLQEPARAIVSIGIYVGLPLLCIILLYIDKKIEVMKGK